MANKAVERTGAAATGGAADTGRIEGPGESADAAAQRELLEETGLGAPVRPLDYVHCFAQRETQPPRLIEETGFAAEAPPGFSPRLDPAEHQRFEWLAVDEALARFPFPGLQEATRRAIQR